MGRLLKAPSPGESGQHRDPDPADDLRHCPDGLVTADLAGVLPAHPTVVPF
jgi:hypothetical protein